MAHDKGSFSYKVVNKRIRDILDARSELNNTAQIAMPFIKATTTISMEDGGTGFTLGLHAINEDVKYENIYSESPDSSMPLIGYTYLKDGTNKRVYADDPSGLITSQTYDIRASLFTSTPVIRTPPPGITKVTIGRNKNGVLAHAQLEIVVPSLIQLEALNRTFLIPGVGMVLEWGQQFAPELVASVGELSNISDNLFPWHNNAELMKLLGRLSLSKIGIEEILEDYTYKAQGQYMWMFGRIGNFSTKSNSDGSFSCTVKIVGPSEDSWAYSTKNTVTPAKDDRSTPFCADKTNSVYSYFANSVTGGNNFKTLLDKIRNEKTHPYHTHVQYFEYGNTQAGEPTDTVPKPNINQEANGISQESYFISWRFFVNVVLNDVDAGVKSIFKLALQNNELDKLSLLLPYADGENRTNTNIGTVPYINDEYESYVGMNKFLRSIDPSTMIIVNETAAALAEKNSQYNLPSSKQNLYAKNAQTKLFYDGNPTGAKTLFDKSISADTDASSKTDRGFLSSGVWLNHNAVVECMLAGSTILRGITNLLERMNAATSNYWNLTLDVAHPEKASDKSYNYMVVDANFRESSDLAVANFINDVHVFNKHARISETGKLVGSELIDCAVDLSLPKLMFSQIATMGLVQPDDIAALGGVDATDVQARLGALEAANKPVADNTKSPKISEPFDSLREMFAIVSLSGRKNSDGTISRADLTVIPKDKRDELLKNAGICGQANAQTTALTGGANVQAGQISLEDSIPPNPTDKDYADIQSKADKYLKENESVCKKCIPVSILKGTYGSRPGRDVVGGNAAPKTLAQVVRDVDAFNKYLSDNNIAPGRKSAGEVGRELQVRENTSLHALGRATEPDTGGHTAESAHDTSQAIDISVYTETKAKIVMEWWNRQGGYDVRDEFTDIKLNHIHIEWNAVIEAPATNIPTPAGAPAPAVGPTLTAEQQVKCKECANQTALLTQVTAKLTEKQTRIEAKIRQFPGLNNLFRYIEVFPEYMVASITNDANGTDANSFGASPATLSISADLTMPGVCGLRVGELFWIDRIPAFYKAFGAFQIISIEDTVGTDGWTTKIHATFNYLGKNWKAAMAEKLKKNS